LRNESSVGRPLGDEEFIIGLERKLGRMLRRRPPAAQGRTEINRGERNKWLSPELPEVLPRDVEDWKLVNALLGERPILLAESRKRAASRAERTLFD